MLQKRKVVIVGVGNVGAATAFCMVNQGICDELGLIDYNREKAYGEVLDLVHSIAFMDRNMHVKLADYSDCADCDVLVITASAPMTKENDRMVALQSSAKIVESIVTEAKQNGFNGYIVIASNPVDIMAYWAWKCSGMDPSRIIGTGTLLDSARLQTHLSTACGVDPKSVDAYVLGEHGDTEMIPWSTVRIGGKSLEKIMEDNPDKLRQDMLEDIHQQVIKDGWEIFNRKGNTCYGIGASTTKIVRAILWNESIVLPVSTYIKDKDVFASLPAILDHTGVNDIVSIDMTEEEAEQFNHSGDILRNYIEKLM